MKTYSWKIAEESINQEITLCKTGNRFVGTLANKIMHDTKRIFRENKVEDNMTNWEYMMTRFIIPSLSKKFGVTILKEKL